MRSDYSGDVLFADRKHGHWLRRIEELDVSLGMRHWFRRPPDTLRLEFNGIPGAAFHTWAVATSRNVLEAGLGLHAMLRRNLSAEVSYRGAYGHHYRSNDVSLRLALHF